MDQDTYCREIEAYLCRKNEGHLVRIVGPAFNMVTSWATRGVPFKVACRGIDRYVERYYAKGPRRRPVRIEFCEADVLDVFDEWRKAVGIGMAGVPVPAMGPASAAAGAEPETGTPLSGEGGLPDKPGHSLRAHLDRIVTRLTDLQTSAGVPAALESLIGRLIEQFAAEREASRALRGEARETYVQLLAERDRELMETARQVTPPDVLTALSDDAAEELSAYRSRMPPEAYERAIGAAAARLLRDHHKLPTLTYGSAL